jgi:hypothetical protein
LAEIIIRTKTIIITVYNRNYIMIQVCSDILLYILKIIK